MAASKELLLAYDDAMAVMSKPCRFVEWKIYGGGEQVESWSPFGLAPDKKGAWKEIEGERWIYVFQSYARTKSAGRWVEELHLNEEGEIAATPMDKARDGRKEGNPPVERDKRPKPLPIGKTMSFARRIHGVAMEYYYFASRIRLPAEAIVAIGPNIAAYAPPINFEEDDRNIVGEKDGALLVPVLDPITIAIHLHAYYVAAANELIDYTTEHKDQSAGKREQVAKRQKKHLLAELIQALIDPKVDTSNELVNRLALRNVDANYRLEYLNEYDQQIAHRLKWRDRWCGFLSRWLESKTMKILARAHEHDAKEDFHKFLIPFCMCVTRVGESPAGRALLDGLFKDGEHWLHRYILPTEEPTADRFQVIRKGGGAVFEAVKEWAPRIILEPAKYGKLRFTQTFNLLAGEKVLSPAQAVIKISDEVVVYSVKQGPRVVQITETQVLLKDASLKPKWEGAAKNFGAIVEAINTCFAIKAVIDAMQGDSTQEQVLAILNLLGSGLDMTTAILQFTKAKVRTLGALGFVSGIIDTVLAVADAVKAYKKEDMGGMIGSGVVALGSALAAGSGLALIAGSSAAGPLGIAALAVVALGYVIKLTFGDNDTPYHKLVTHCEWGDKAGKGSDKPDWAPAPYKDWKGDYDLQLRAAINVLCGMSVEVNDPMEPREARVKVNWVPTGATLLFVYHEEWSAAGSDVVFSDTFRFDPSGPVPSSYLLTIKARDKKSYVVRPHKTASERPVLTSSNSWPPVPRKADGVEKIWVEAQLSFELGSTKYLIPNEKKHKETLLD